MTQASYLDGRVVYQRPQAAMFSDTGGTLENNWTASGMTATISYGSTSILSSSITGVKVGQNIEVTSTGINDGAVGINAKVAAINPVPSNGLYEITSSVAHTKNGPITFRTGDLRYIPSGTDIYNASGDVDDKFMILSDHNRSPIDITPERIEKRERMVNGRMRSYHVADKLKIQISWSNLPSRAYPGPAEINLSTGKSSVTPYTVDGGAGGNEILAWYENHVGPFYVFLAYDKYTVYGQDAAAYGHLGDYSQVLEMYVSDFSHTVTARGSLYDMWDVSVTLEEA